jgi:Anti-sigma-K factor rskA
VTQRPPDFDELVGSDLDGPERDRLRQVHELLVAAGPPPDVSTWSAPAIETAAAKPAPARRRRRSLVLAFAAVAGMVVAFSIGLAVAAGDDSSPDRVIAMSGPGGATASLEVYDIDEAGNWPMLFDVTSLRPAAGGKLYELWLTKDGDPAAFCGSFRTDESGRAVVPMNAPWRFSDFDGWVVVEQGSKTPLLST